MLLAQLWVFDILALAKEEKGAQGVPGAVKVLG